MTSLVESPALKLKVVGAGQFAAAAADEVGSLLRRKPDAVIGLPTGNTPMPVYAELLRRHREEGLDLSRFRAVVLDDFLGIHADSPTSFYAWLRRALLDPAAVGPERVLRIPTSEEGIEQHCRTYESKLRQLGGCDLQLLGLGTNGHIGFNEPGSPGDSRTRVVKLTEESRAASAGYWKNQAIPTHGVTMGIATILEAHRIALLVNGAKKAPILRRALLGPISSDVPASFLRQGKGVVVIADEPAAEGLK
jgi:glucosamine-6-phosphate deaminase